MLLTWMIWAKEEKIKNPKQLSFIHCASYSHISPKLKTFQNDILYSIVVHFSCNIEDAVWPLEIKYFSVILKQLSRGWL